MLDHENQLILLIFGDLLAVCFIWELIRRRNMKSIRLKLGICQNS
jgi:hypothetical protein